MKVVCDTCGTKYSIDDNRVSGKSFKIRCKKCARVILTRGKTAPVTEPVADADAWHVVIDGAHRPIALAELHRLRAAGALDDGALVWREGWADWRALGTIDELRDAGPPSVEVAPDAESAVAGRAALRHERNETSVLFSLGNLAKLAAPAPATAAPATAGEGSGLLDIRSIARTLAPAGARAGAARGSQDDLPVHRPVSFAEPVVLVPVPPRGRDRRLVWALATSVGMLAVVTAVLVALVVRDGGSAHADGLPPATAKAVPAAPGTAATPAQTAAATAPAQTAAAVTPAQTAAAATPAQTAAVITPAQTAAVVTPAQTAAAVTPAQTAAAVTPSAAARVTRHSAAHAAATADASTVHTASAASRHATARTTSAEPVTPATLQPKQAADRCSEVTCIVNGYADQCCAIYREAASGHVATPPPGSALPDGLDRPAIAAGLAQIDTKGCHEQSAAHGDVKVSIRVSAAGAVTAVIIKSSPDPALSACVTAAANKATFSPTQRGGSFAYLWRF